MIENGTVIPNDNPDSEYRMDIRFEITEHLSNTATLFEGTALTNKRVVCFDRFSTVESRLTWFPGRVQPSYIPTELLDRNSWKDFLYTDNTSMVSNADNLGVDISNSTSHGVEFAEVFTTATVVEKLANVIDNIVSDMVIDLQRATEEAREEGFPVPSQIALSNAERLLGEMYRILPRRFEIYPTPDGEIAIDVPTGRGSSVILLCDSLGEALCLVNQHGIHRRNRYTTTDSLPDSFLREALMERVRENS